jgi:hypothetical protein
LIDTPDNEDKNHREHVHGGGRPHPWSDITKGGEHRAGKVKKKIRENTVRVACSVKYLSKITKKLYQEL